MIQYSSDTVVLYLIGLTVGIEPPLLRVVTEGVNRTVEYCVVVTVPNVTVAIEREDLFVCVSTMDGTAVGKNVWLHGTWCCSLMKEYLWAGHLPSSGSSFQC